jgi:hypothetical protein
MIEYGKKVNLLDDNCFEGVGLYLIDFGFASQCADLETGVCLPKKVVQCFKGNIWFAS